MDERIIMTKKNDFIENKNEKAITILSYGRCACTGLTFDTLPINTRSKIERKTYDEFNKDLNNNLLKTKCLILTREINTYSILLAKLCLALGIPYYYYTDDNFFELGITAKTDENINFLKSAKACILTSTALVNYFKENNFNDIFYSVVPAISEEQKREVVINLEKYNEPKQINFLYASNNRFDGVLNMSNVFIELAKEYSVKFFIFPRNEKIDELKEFHLLCAQNNIKIEYMEAYENHGLFIKRIADLNIHFIIHPESFTNPLFTLNHKYKTLNFLLNAYLSSSLIFVPNLYPYSELNKEGLISDIVYSNADEVYARIKKILHNPDLAKKLFRALEKYCLTNFDPKINENVILEILEKSTKKIVQQ